MKNYQSILLSIVGFVISYLTMAGTLQEYIYFEGVLNEMAVCVFSLTIGILGLVSIDYKKLLIGLK